MAVLVLQFRRSSLNYIILILFLFRKKILGTKKK